MTASGLDTYLNGIGRLPVLTEEAQLRHCQRISRWINWPGGRDSAPENISRSGRRSMDVMLATNLRLVVSVARRYTGRGLDLEDLIQEGNIGLVRGLELFDPTRGYRFSTYAYWWIRQAMTRALYAHARTIRLPINAYELLYKAHRLQAEHLSNTGCTLSIPEMAEHLGVTAKRLAAVYEMSAATECFSLDAPIEGCSDSAFIDMAVYDSTPGQTTPDLPEFLELVSNPQRAAYALSHLDPRERQVIHALYFEDRTTRCVATELGISQVKVRQIASRACRTLRLHLADCVTP